MENNPMKSNIKKRLNRIEGQIRGIQKMIDKDEGCSDILIQIAAVRAAINKVGGLILEGYAKECIKSVAANNEEDSIDHLIDTVVKFIK